MIITIKIITITIIIISVAMGWLDQNTLKLFRTNFNVFKIELCYFAVAFIVNI